MAGSQPNHDPSVEAVAKMRASAQPEVAVRSFAVHLERLLAGESGLVGGRSIAPVEGLPSSADLGRYRGAGESALARLVVIKLNGGLGTSMGLERAKSLIEVRGRLTFLDLIARQVLALGSASGTPVPLLLMNSFRTERDSLDLLAAYPELARQGHPLSFLQHQVPRLLADSMLPATNRSEPELEWCPPGHGDLFAALYSSRVLERLLEHGVEYAFVSNADNLGAMVDTALLGMMLGEGVDLLLEAADRTPSDRKGGHLCRLADGRLGLREWAQCPPEESAEFQDVSRYRFFNTNSMWLHLPALARLLEHHRGVLPLPTIVNHKPLDPGDPSSPAVIQLETAMGAALALFPRAAAVRVPRQRFSPVKTTGDLLAVRSDAFLLGPDHRLTLDPRRSLPPMVHLDDRYYGLLKDFEQRFPEGPPSLIGCEELWVEGDVRFCAGVTVVGRTRVRASGRDAVVPPGMTLSGEVEL